MPWALIAAILPLLIQLVTWLINRKKSGVPLTARQLQRFGALAIGCRHLNEAGVECGCLADDDSALAAIGEWDKEKRRLGLEKNP